MKAIISVSKVALEPVYQVRVNDCIVACSNDEFSARVYVRVITKTLEALGIEWNVEGL